MTSLNAPGFSLSLLNLSSISRALSNNAASTETISVSELLSFIDAPTEATSWSGVRCHWPGQGARRDASSEEQESLKLLGTFSAGPAEDPSTGSDSTQESSRATFGIGPERLKSAIRGSCDAVLAVENELTQFDTVVGDGDCGETFSSGARGLSSVLWGFDNINFDLFVVFCKAVLKALNEGTLNVDRSSYAELMASLSELLLNSMGGTSGACKQSPFFLSLFCFRVQAMICSVRSLFYGSLQRFLLVDPNPRSPSGSSPRTLSVHTRPTRRSHHDRRSQSILRIPLKGREPPFLRRQSSQGC